jgi:NAD(P)-dependent dehydrogenase (short-subunit alcohol dehydrogenase family)
MTQRVLVTAGAFGIGREICRAFLASGAKVFTCDIDAKALDTLAKELPDVKSSLCDILAKRHTQQPPGPKWLIGFQRDRRVGGLSFYADHAAVRLSALGTKRTFAALQQFVRDWGRADNGKVTALHLP